MGVTSSCVVRSLIVLGSVDSVSLMLLLEAHDAAEEISRSRSPLHLARCMGSAERAKGNICASTLLHFALRHALRPVDVALWRALRRCACDGRGRRRQMSAPYYITQSEYVR